MDPNRVRAARSAGDPVVYGDGAQAEILEAVGLEHCRVLVLTFADPDVSMRHSESRARVAPGPARARAHARRFEARSLQKAGATEVVPETLEASLMLASHLLLLLDVPVSRVVKTIGDIRNDRYALLRRLFRRDDARPLDETHVLREELHTVVLPPGAFAVGKSIADLELDKAEVVITGIRRDGILGR